MSIKILPQNVIQKIAAGEVVERPASVLKELIENSLDAQADHIKILLEEGGKNKIQVIDNGLSLEKEDLEIAFERHSTSKIKNEADLLNLQSLGFRGEALFSISAVSQIQFKTKTAKSSFGNSLEVEGGQKKEIKKIGCPQGTDLTISHLFYNTPARIKFLKTTSTELKACKEIFHRQALGYPHVRFELWHNNKNLSKLPSQNFKDRIIVIYNLNEKDLLEISFDHPYLQISGFIGKPGIARNKKIKQHLFVNNRSVENKIVYQALKNAYSSYLPNGAYPLFFLKLKLRPDLIDVNIHPRKEEIKFASSQIIFDSLRKATLKTLSTQDLTPQAKIISLPSEKSLPFKKSKPLKSNLIQASMEFNRHFSFQESPSSISFKDKKATRSPSVFPQDNENPVSETPNQIFQVALTYLIEIKQKEILIYDQHATHERILFEKFTSQYLKKQERGENQALLFPETIDLDDHELEILKQEIKILEKIGFELEIKEKQVNLLAIPLSLDSQNLKPKLLDFIDSLESDEDLEIETDWQIDSKTKRTLTFLSCHSAVKAGDYLNHSQMKKLIEEFHQTQKRYTCPHGRPVLVKLDRFHLDKIFMRHQKDF